MCKVTPVILHWVVSPEMRLYPQTLRFTVCFGGLVLVRVVGVWVRTVRTNARELDVVFRILALGENCLPKKV